MNCQVVASSLLRVLDGQRVWMSNSYWQQGTTVIVGDYHGDSDSIDTSRQNAQGGANTIDQIVQIARHEAGHAANWNDAEISQRMPGCL